MHISFDTIKAQRVLKSADPFIAGYSRYDEIVGKLSPFLKGAGYNPKTEVTFIPVSGYTGSNIKTRADKSVQSFYDGPGLLEHLDELPVTDRKINAPFMMPISEKYKDMGTIIVGKIESGRVRRGDSVLLMPNKVRKYAIYYPIARTPFGRVTD